MARQQVYGSGRRPQEPQSGIRGTVDRALPPFSIRRYAAIWVLGMIPLVLVILWLAQPWKGGSAVGTDKFMVIDTAKGRIVARLYTDAAAGVGKTIANFEQKASSGYFNGLTFHRVEPWVIQGGDPQGTGGGGGTMPSEYNQLTFKAGALGVARGNNPALNNDSQFFITKTDANWLDSQYTNWGQVVTGMDVVNQIAIGDKINSVAITDKQP